MARPRSRVLAVFKVVYWAVVIAVPVALIFVAPRRYHEVLVNQVTTIFYVAGAAAVYRLLLLIAWHATDSDAVEQEIRTSDGRIELNLDDRIVDPSWFRGPGPARVGGCPRHPHPRPTRTLVDPVALPHE